MTLFTLGTNELNNESNNEAHEKITYYSRLYFKIALAVLAFGFIYEQFGHGVYSNFMIYAFAIPLIFGTAFWQCVANIKRRIVISKSFTNLQGAAIATLTVGFIYKGILDIYGTAGSLTKVYWIAGGVLFIAMIFSFVAGLKNRV